MSRPGLARASLLLARKDLTLERRSPALVLSLALFAPAVLLLFHLALAAAPARTVVRAATGVLWVAILLAALLAIGRAFAPERDEGLLDALLLFPVSRTAIWLSKALVLLILLTGSQLVLLPLHWLFFFESARAAPRLGAVLAAVALADVGIAATGAFVASLASATRQRELLLPLLFLPLVTPLLILGVSASLPGAPLTRDLGLIGLFDIVVCVLAGGAYERLITE